MGVRILSLLLASCSSGGEDYRPCELDPASPNEEVAACGAEDDATKTCVVRDQIQCDRRICARLVGSDPFCTQTCGKDKDCEYDGDTCVDWAELGKFCRPADL